MTGSTEPLELKARAFAERFAAGAGADLESIVYSPYPFSGGQLLIACKDSVRYLHEVAAIAAPLGPPEIPTHWLRLSELGSLTWPQFTVPFLYTWGLTGGYPGWSFWLRHLGCVLWGGDIRELIPLPADPRRVLEATLVGSYTYNRDNVFLGLLVAGKYDELLQIAAGLARRLMATGLLVIGEWQVDEATVFDRFSRAFGTGGDAELCAELSATLGGEHAPIPGPAEPAELERRAYEAVWLVESLARMLRRYAA